MNYTKIFETALDNNIIDLRTYILVKRWLTNLGVDVEKTEIGSYTQIYMFATCVEARKVRNAGTKTLACAKAYLQYLRQVIETEDC